MNEKDLKNKLKIDHSQNVKSKNKSKATKKLKPKQNLWGKSKDFFEKQDLFIFKSHARGVSLDTFRRDGERWLTKNKNIVDRKLEGSNDAFHARLMLSIFEPLGKKVTITNLIKVYVSYGLTKLVSPSFRAYIQEKKAEKLKAKINPKNFTYYKNKESSGEGLTLRERAEVKKIKKAMGGRIPYTKESAATSYLNLIKMAYNEMRPLDYKGSPEEMQKKCEDISLKFNLAEKTLFRTAIIDGLTPSVIDQEAREIAAELMLKNPENVKYFQGFLTENYKLNKPEVKMHEVVDPETGEGKYIKKYHYDSCIIDGDTNEISQDALVVRFPTSSQEYASNYADKLKKLFHKYDGYLVVEDFDNVADFTLKAMENEVKGFNKKDFLKNKGLNERHLDLKNRLEKDTPTKDELVKSVFEKELYELATKFGACMYEDYHDPNFIIDVMVDMKEHHFLTLKDYQRETKANEVQNEIDTTSDDFLKNPEKNVSEIEKEVLKVERKLLNKVDDLTKDESLEDDFEKKD